jgi:hypothetical protein
MQTLLFVDNGHPFQCGFQLSKHNFHYSPPGRIRVARFETAFSPLIGFGYYGDVYLRRFIRTWKKKVILKRRNKDKKMAVLYISKKNMVPKDILRYIVDFL